MSPSRTLPSWPPLLTAGRNPRRILLSMAWVGHGAWAFRPRFLRGTGHRDTLFAGPWVGEFGWELLNWQAFLRALRPRYRRIIACGRPSSEPLYRGVCDEFIPHSLQGQANSHVLLDVENPDELERVLALVPGGADHLFPLRYIPAHAQAFVRMGDASACPDPLDVLFHARGRSYVPGRNWPSERWLQLAEGLSGRGLRVGCIGLSRDTLDLPGLADRRDATLDASMDQIAAARLVLGPSSGPLHLASLCGTPHLVWTDRRTYGMGKTSRDKYERWWNPLATPVRVLDEFGFDPPVAAVLQTSLEMLGQQSD